MGPNTQLHSSDILLSFDAVSARRSLDLMGRDEGIDVFRRLHRPAREGNYNYTLARHPPTPQISLEHEAETLSMLCCLLLVSLSCPTNLAARGECAMTAENILRASRDPAYFSI